jgi:hypothetical protein
MACSLSSPMEARTSCNQALHGPSPPDTANLADAPADTGGTDAAADSADDACVPVACIDEYGESFCGTICDGCGHTLDCGETCPRTGWMCRNNVCGPTDVCASLGCVHSSDESEYCGDIGDGCGGTLSCPLACPKAGWVCQDNICVDCPATCPNGDQCGEAHTCGTGANGGLPPAPPVPIPPPSGTWPEPTPPPVPPLRAPSPPPLAPRPAPTPPPC